MAGFSSLARGLRAPPAHSSGDRIDCPCRLRSTGAPRWCAQVDSTISVRKSSPCTRIRLCSQRRNSGITAGTGNAFVGATTGSRSLNQSETLSTGVIRNEKADGSRGIRGTGFFDAHRELRPGDVAAHAHRQPEPGERVPLPRHRADQRQAGAAGRLRLRARQRPVCRHLGEQRELAVRRRRRRGSATASSGTCTAATRARPARSATTSACCTTTTRAPTRRASRRRTPPSSMSPAPGRR